MRCASQVIGIAVCSLLLCGLSAHSKPLPIKDENNDELAPGAGLAGLLNTTSEELAGLMDATAPIGRMLFGETQWEKHKNNLVGFLTALASILAAVGPLWNTMAKVGNVVGNVLVKGTLVLAIFVVIAFMYVPPESFCSIFVTAEELLGSTPLPVTCKLQMTFYSSQTIIALRFTFKFLAKAVLCLSMFCPYVICRTWYAYHMTWVPFLTAFMLCQFSGFNKQLYLPIFFFVYIIFYIMAMHVAIQGGEVRDILGLQFMWIAPLMGWNIAAEEHENMIK